MVEHHQLCAVDQERKGVATVHDLHRRSIEIGKNLCDCLWQQGQINTQPSQLVGRETCR